LRDRGSGGVLDGPEGARGEVIGTAMSFWTGWGLRLLVVLLLPAVAVAHGAVVVWLLGALSDAHPLLMMLILILLLFLALAVPIVGLVAMGLWVSGTEDDDPAGGVLVAGLLLALGGLVAGYVGTLVAVDSWELRRWGAETTCAVRHVGSLGGDAPAEGPAPVTHIYDLECVAVDAPDDMRLGSFVEPGEGIAVVYDPDGHVGAQPKSQVDEGVTWALGTGIAMAVWTVLTLAKMYLELLRRREGSYSDSSATAS
jgi:hypothetical protein